MHDTLNLEAAGVPSLFVATTEFIDGANAQAKALGAEPEALYIAHPIQDRSDEEMRALADGAIEELLAKLVA